MDRHMGCAVAALAYPCVMQRRRFIFFARTAPDVKPWLDKDAIIS
jgi:hypothetical protein